MRHGQHMRDGRINNSTDNEQKTNIENTEKNQIIRTEYGDFAEEDVQESSNTWKG